MLPSLRRVRSVLFMSGHPLSHHQANSPCSPDHHSGWQLSICSLSRFEFWRCSEGCVPGSCLEEESMLLFLYLSSQVWGQSMPHPVREGTLHPSYKTQESHCPGTSHNFQSFLVTLSWNSTCPFLSWSSDNMRPLGTNQARLGNGLISKRKCEQINTIA